MKRNAYERVDYTSRRASRAHVKACMGHTPQERAAASRKEQAWLKARPVLPRPTDYADYLYQCQVYFLTPCTEPQFALAMPQISDTEMPFLTWENGVAKVGEKPLFSPARRLEPH